MKRTVLLAALLAVGLVGCVSSGVEVKEWPMTEREERILGALAAQEREIAAGIAPVLTATVQPLQVVRFVEPRLRSIDQTWREVELEASSRCGAAVVLSGSTWVVKR